MSCLFARLGSERLWPSGRCHSSVPVTVTVRDSTAALTSQADGVTHVRSPHTWNVQVRSGETISVDVDCHFVNLAPG